jgi:crotonobetainyl-CoA:carnitine CoA-transferase CaiB-like acyl-CoA transferase
MHARSENRVELIKLLTAKLATASAADWADRLRPLGLAVGAVVGLEAALDSDYDARRGMVVTIPTDDGPLRVVGNPIRTDGVGEFTPPPRLHEHTEELLGDAPDA